MRLDLWPAERRRQWRYPGNAIVDLRPDQRGLVHDGADSVSDTSNPFLSTEIIYLRRGGVGGRAKLCDGEFHGARTQRLSREIFKDA